MPVAALEAADEEEEDAEEGEADDHHRAAAPLVDVDDGGDGEGDIEDVLHARGDEVATAAGEARALEDVGDVVHHDVHAGELGPRLEGHAEPDAAEHAGHDKVRVGLGALGALERDLRGGVSAGGRRRTGRGRGRRGPAA